MQYSLVGTEEGQNITVFVDGAAPLVAHSSHPNFAQILERVLNNDESAIDLFDIASAAGKKFDKVTERVSVANGKLYLDGDRIDNALADQVGRFMREGVEDWKPLVNFFENVQSNPNEHSREQLYTWLKAADFTITPQGYIVGYKGVKSDKNGGYVSISQGPAIVDGVAVNGAVPNNPGSVVEMARGDVAHDPSTACSTGLHVGTYEYAQGFGYGVVLEVQVNPRDVVSVPTDCSGQKMRTCRYTVIQAIEVPYEAPIRYDDDEWDYCEDCGCHNEDCDCFCEDCGCFVDENEVRFSRCHCEDDVNPDQLTVDDLVDEESPVRTSWCNGVSAVVAGDVFQSTDSRRQDTTFKVESIEGEYAVGKSLPKNLTRKIRIDRLTSRAYRKV
jgi:hypothetical protein